MCSLENDFKYYIELAKTESANGNNREFARSMWNALSSFTKNHYKKKFHIDIATDDDLEQVYEATCAGLSGSRASDIMEVWVDVYWPHITSGGNGGFIPTAERNDLIARFEQVTKIIENADVVKIRETLITISPVFEQVIHNRDAEEVQTARNNPLSCTKRSYQGNSKAAEVSRKRREMMHSRMQEQTSQPKNAKSSPTPSVEKKPHF